MNAKLIQMGKTNGCIIYLLIEAAAPSSGDLILKLFLFQGILNMKIPLKHKGYIFACIYCVGKILNIIF